ncbi:MAG TPA: acyl-CoA desaturase [Pseudomonadales bacterium]|nr:acyl-CoA desaturase [Pseudomonadales bacterium]
MTNYPLSPAEIEALGKELEAIRSKVLAKLGEEDANYIRSIFKTVRVTEALGRGLLFLGWLPPAWLAGTALLSISKIIDNMELGHNVMHGQFDWMNDKLLNTQFEWDNVCPGDEWRHSHNYMHHTFTNIIDKDRDIGYGIARMFPEQAWKPSHLGQPIYILLLALLFEWGVALHDLELDRVVEGKTKLSGIKGKAKSVFRKMRKQVLKDYVFFPLIAGPSFIPVLTGNLTANVVRNVWAFAIIFCGHFTENAHVFPESVLENETRSQWYLRQLLGSCNIEGGPLFHILSGNLSHQIEHHLYPDIPANRYAEMAKEVKAVCKKYGLPYNTGSFSTQFSGMLSRVFKYALPIYAKESDRSEQPKSAEETIRLPVAA